MQLGEPGKINSTINVTPLVDVVLVLLIIFMVVAPAMQRGPGPQVDLPKTERPREQDEGRDRIVVTINDRGDLWIDDHAVPPEQFQESLRAAAGPEPDPKVVIRGDARLQFGDVRRAMLAIEDAGYHGAGLIAEKAGEKAQGE